MKTVVVPIAEGFEEIEAISIIDVLRRAEINVITACVDGCVEARGAHGIVVRTDTDIKNIHSDEIDMIVLPGGWGGTKILAHNETVQSLLKSMDEKNKFIGAICAAPYALDKAGVLKEKYTCYPSIENEIHSSTYDGCKRVIKDQNILTSKGPATAMCFGLEIVKTLLGEDVKERVRAGLLADFCD